MRSSTRSRFTPALPLLALALAAPTLSQVAKSPQSPLDSLVRMDERLAAPPAFSVPLAAAGAALRREIRDDWGRFLQEAPGPWQADVDKAAGRITFAEGVGIPWLSSSARVRQAPKLDELERLARAFLPRVERLLAVDPATLVLHRGRSGHPADHLWFVDFDVVLAGLPVEGARVVFRVSHGSLIQFGSENLPPPGAEVPEVRLAAEDARAAVAAYVGGIGPEDEIVDAGSLRLLPSAAGLLAAWDVTFRRPGVTGTWRGRVDATDGELLAFEDLNGYAQVSGGVYPFSPAVGPEVVRPMPFAQVNPGALCAGRGGIYVPGALPATAALNGCFVRVLDSCGAISLGSDPAGNLAFGTSGGANCTTPGFGGAGNTHAARTQFYRINRALEAGRAWLPANPWLSTLFTVNTNLNMTCNAFWNGASLNLFRSGGGCGSTSESGEIALHEYGHGQDENDGSGGSPDGGTRETYGDFTTALVTHSSCIGRGFLPGNCTGYGDACLACTGVRDIDWAQHASGTPHTVDNFTRLRCAASPTFRGPCGRQGHCESYVSSEALWDFPARDLPGPGSPAAWRIAERLWYLSRPTATQAFQCATSLLPWASNGCNAGSLWRTMRAVDDDDADPTNGTPHSCHLFAAFDRHGLACATDFGANVCFAGCTPPVIPILSLATGTANQVQLNWTNSGAGVVYDVYKSEDGCNSGFIKIANDVAGTAFADGQAASQVAASYQVIAHAAGNEACAATASSCETATPCATTAFYLNDFELGAPGWTLGPDWPGVQTCAAHTGFNILRFGGAACTGDYGINRVSLAQPAPAGIAIPAGSNTTRLSFWHRRRFESNADGGNLRLSLDGTNFVTIPSVAFVAGSYNGSIGSFCAPPGTAGVTVFTGNQAAFAESVVNLDAACVLAGAPGGCAGQAVRVGFQAITDCSVNDDGWFLDDVRISACVP